MAKGTRTHSEHSARVDRRTGARIHQMTDRPCVNHATYFLQSSFTGSGQALIFISTRDGLAQIYEVAPFPHGPVRQLTDGEPVHPFSPAIHPDGERVFFVRGGSVWVLERSTLRERLVAHFRDAQLGECSLSSDGWITAAFRGGGQPGLVVGRQDGRDWHLISFPRTVIHPQFHPADPEWIEFSGDPAPRMHRVRRDSSRLECLYEHGNDEFVVHETFLGTTGNLVYTVWPKALCCLEWDSRRRRIIAEFNAWHITPNRAGTLVLCDTNHPDEGLFLVDVATGGRRCVCLSESSNRGTQWTKSRYALAEDFRAAQSAAKSGGNLSWMEVPADTVYGPQWTHPHPSFSPDEKMVVFASDRTGYPQVYVAEIPELRSNLGAR